MSLPVRPIAVAMACCLALAGCVFYLKPKCDDQIRNGSESDVDCGGDTCRPCSVGRRCGTGADCESTTCLGGTCAPLPCENGVKDGAETDVDCGGGTCARCAGARTCLADTDCFNGSCESTTRTCSSLRTVSFDPGVAYGASYKTYVMASADMNGDGHLDLVAANEEGSSLTVLLGWGDGTFRSVAGDFLTGEYPTGVVVADFNGDGIPDVATANYHGNSVSILLGVGDGTVQPASNYPTEPGAQTSNLAVGDLNGDGIPDVVATNPATASATMFLGKADGTLHPGVKLLVGVQGYSSPFSAAIADFDGDGKNDVAIADMATRSILVRLGNGDGTFRPEVGYPVGGLPSYVVIASDINLDGKVDLVVANRGSDDVTVLLGRGDGTFRDAIVSSTGTGTGPYAVAVADFNLDGVPDVVTPNFRTSTASVLLGVGNGHFQAPVDAGPTGDTTYGVASGDFNEDGKPDFAVCNALSNDVVVKISASR